MPCHLALLDPSRSCEYAQQGREDARGRWKRKGDTRSKDESSSQSRESVRAARQRGEKASSTRRQRAVCEASVRASARLVASEREDGSQVVDIAQRVARVLVFLGDLSRSASRGVDLDASCVTQARDRIDYCCCWLLASACQPEPRLALPDCLKHLGEHLIWCAACSTRARARKRRARGECDARCQAETSSREPSPSTPCGYADSMGTSGW